MKSKQAKQAEAKARLEMWQLLGTEMQIRILDKRLGVGVGAKKQREKLAGVK